MGCGGFAGGLTNSALGASGPPWGSFLFLISAQVGQKLNLVLVFRLGAAGCVAAEGAGRSDGQAFGAYFFRLDTLPSQ